MAQPSELTSSQPPPEASPDKRHHLDDVHQHQQDGQPAPPTDATGATSAPKTTVTSNITGANAPVNNDGSASRSGTGCGGRGNGDESENGGTGEAVNSTAHPAHTQPSGGGGRIGDRREGHQPADTSPTAQPGTATAPCQSTLPGGTTSSSRNGGQPGQNGSTSAASDSQSPPAPPMSNTQPPPPGPPRQPVSYPSPNSFPSPGIPPTAQYAYAPQPSPHPDPYRASPTVMNSPMPLPSMRTLDPLQAQHAHGMPMGSPMGAPMPSPAGPMYYGMSSHPYGMPSDPNALRYSLPPNMTDPRIALSGGRHKKEIKRRTKTGCLTCRKRRIKCDETHPTCNNCKKSKRECLGYDPIFKQQQQQQGSVGVPNSQAPPTPGALVSPPTLPSSAAPHPTHPAHHHHPFQPSVVPSSYPPPTQPDSSFESPLLSAAAKQVKSEGGFEYSTAIDPALQGADPSTAPNLAHYSQLPAGRAVGGAASSGGQKPEIDAGGLRGGASSPSNPLEALQRFSCYYQPQEAALTYTDLPAKKMRVDELVSLGGREPPAPSHPPAADMVAEIVRLYYEIYVPGLTSFFESSWYDLSKDRPTAENSLDLLRQNAPVLNLFASFIQSITAIRTSDPADMAYSGHLENCVVWALARLPSSSGYQTSSHQPPDPFPAEDDGAELRNRLVVFEALLSGEILQSNPLTPPTAIPTDKSFSKIRANELDFWYHLAQYTQQAHSTSSPADISIREQCLGRIRSVLDGRENRDVLYSIAVLREYAPQFDALSNEQSVPPHLDEMDPRSKLAVATRFIRDESASTGGTTNVVRRFADLAYRAFIRPGVNVNSSMRRS